MPRDYKNSGRGRRKQPPPPKGAPGWLMFLAGLLVGLAMTMGLWVYEYGVPTVIADKLAATSDSRGPGSPAEEITKEVVEIKPTFDFYTILPEMEVAVPEWKVRESAQGSASPPKAGLYVLQAGSFRSAKDAERRKAELALLGMQAEIQSVAVNGRDTWHRVRIGPIADAQKVEVLRQRLIEQKIDAMLLRLRTED